MIEDVIACLLVSDDDDALTHSRHKQVSAGLVGRGGDEQKDVERESVFQEVVFGVICSFRHILLVPLPSSSLVPCPLPPPLHHLSHSFIWLRTGPRPCYSQPRRVVLVLHWLSPLIRSAAANTSTPSTGYEEAERVMNLSACLRESPCFSYRASQLYVFEFPTLCF